MDNIYRIATAFKCVIVGIILMSDKLVNLNAQGKRYVKIVWLQLAWNYYKLKRLQQIFIWA